MIMNSDENNKINLLVCCSGSVATIKLIEIIDLFIKAGVYNISIYIILLPTFL